MASKGPHVASGSFAKGHRRVFKMGPRGGCPIRNGVRSWPEKGRGSWDVYKWDALAIETSSF